MTIRACLSLLIATVIKGLVTPQVFGHVVWRVFAIPIRLQSFSESNLRTPLRLVGKGRLVQWMIVVSAGQNCPSDPGQLVLSAHVQRFARLRRIYGG